MKWHHLFIVAVMAASCVIFTTPSTARAEILYESISDVSVPMGLSIEMQGLFPGYIMYKVTPTPEGYTVLMTRDDPPHQFPVFTAFFDKNWTALSKTDKVMPVDPEVEKRKAEEAKRKEDQARQQAEQERQRIQLFS